MISLDQYLKIGKSHKVCEDYVLSGYHPLPHIIISDGCSSSKGTDMGARILCYTARRYIDYHYASNYNMNDPERMGTWIIHNAETAARQLGLSLQALDATLIVAVERSGSFEITFFGDGYYLINDSILMGITYEPKNAPYYLSYKLDSYRDTSYHKFKNELVATMYDYIDGFVDDIESFSYDHVYSISYPISGIKRLALFSDGIASFKCSLDGRLYTPSQALQTFEMLDFKTTEGEFLKRRMGARRGAMKLADERGFHNTDDLAMGVFLVEEDQ